MTSEEVKLKLPRVNVKLFDGTIVVGSISYGRRGNQLHDQVTITIPNPYRVRSSERGSRVSVPKWYSFQSSWELIAEHITNEVPINFG